MEIAVCGSFGHVATLLHCPLSRSPENATIKQKMLYTSSKDALKKTLVGVGKEFQACDYGDLEWSGILDTLLRMEVAH